MSSYARPAREVMTSPVITIPAGATLLDAERRMDEGGVAGLAVVDGAGALAGVISRTDLLRVGRRRAVMAEDAALLALPRQHVHQQMAPQPITVTPDTPVDQVAARLVEHAIHRVYVVDGGVPVGVISTRDLLGVVTDARDATPLSALMSAPVLTIEAVEPLDRATDRLATAHVRGLVVVEDGWPIGIFTQAEALAAHAGPATQPVDNAMSASLLCLPESLPAFRAAHFALATRARRILAVASREPRGVVTGMDFARLVAGRITTR